MQDNTSQWGLHSVLAPFGTHAQHIHSIWVVMLWVCGFMYLLVLAFTALMVWRQRQNAVQGDDAEPQQRKLMVTLFVWGGMVTIGLFSLTLMSFITDRNLLQAATQPEIELTVKAHQWWWEIEYNDPDPSRRVHTANEIHLPVNVPVRATLIADDVIHSFWVPNLHGKVDLIPGRTNEIRLQPVAMGHYRGECAEFCGVQHAHMAFDVTVQSDADFKAWQDGQLTEAHAPGDAATQQGQRVFLAAACTTCHTISGTDANATVGPDLSHVGSRATIAAGALTNNADNMRLWLSDPHKVKPGNHMPSVSLRDDEVDALVAYLGSPQ